MSVHRSRGVRPSSSPLGAARLGEGDSTRAPLELPREKLPRRKLAVVSVVALVFGIGATVGDIGSCGKDPAELDAATFSAARKSVDCQKCTECSLTTQRCVQACADAASTETFPPLCAPLYQDGLVCLRALLSSSCDDYALFMSDTEKLVPTECQFCRGPVEGGEQ